MTFDYYYYYYTADVVNSDSVPSGLSNETVVVVAVDAVVARQVKFEYHFGETGAQSITDPRVRGSRRSAKLKKRK